MSRNVKSAGFFRRAFDGIVAARAEQARVSTAPYLLALDDQALEALGHDRRTLEALARRRSPFI
jgi:hypothetical protein